MSADSSLVTTANLRKAAPATARRGEKGVIWLLIQMKGVVRQYYWPLRKERNI